MHSKITRRRCLSALGATAASSLLRPFAARAQSLPTAAVAVARCKTYGAAQVVSTLATMFDRLGGLEGLVQGQTVGIKLNLVDNPWVCLGDFPVELTHWVHPTVIGATVYLLGRAGARRIRLLECCDTTTVSFEEFISWAGWDYRDFLNAASLVEFENTNTAGSGSGYSRIWCPYGGHIFPGYDVNHSYVDCDVLVSLAKMKEHGAFGVTLSMKNLYGITPLSIYGEGAGVDEPGDAFTGMRQSVMHNGTSAPSRSAPQEIDPYSPREGGYRLPRIIADIVSARPLDLAIIDGIESMAGGEGPWRPDVRQVSPGLLVAGFNGMTTDAVTMALMGFDPMAERGTPPFDRGESGCDSFLHFAEHLNLGTRDLNDIEVVGTPIAQARFNFRGV